MSVFMLINLLLAVKQGNHPEVLRILNTEGIANINDRLEEGLLANQTALEIACSGYSIAIIQTLIASGALFNAVNSQAIITNMLRSFHSPRAQIIKMKIMKIMLENGVDIEFFQQALANETIHSYQDLLLHLRTIDRFNFNPSLTDESFIAWINNYSIIEGPVAPLINPDSQITNIEYTASTVLDSQASNATTALYGSDSQASNAATVVSGAFSQASDYSA